MFNKILVPLDGSEAAESILPYVNKLSLLFNSQVDLIGVFTEMESRLSRMFGIYMEKVAGDLQGKGIKTKVALASGTPVEQILDYAEENNVNLIAITTYGRSGAKRWLVGSAATQIMRAANVPILVVLPGKLTEELTIKKVLAPLDGPETREFILPYVEEMAQKTVALCILLHVLAPPPPMVTSFMDIKPAEEQSRNLVKNQLDSVAAELAGKGIKVESEVIPGDPAAIILDYAETENVDLIIMPTHSRGGISRWLLGNIAEKVLTNSSKPVLAIRVV
jgi:Universal stress protein UspA and related nucleotide-binding proteins